jgi:hypothetical protein
MASPEAELWVIKVPVDDEPDDPGSPGLPPPSEPGSRDAARRLSPGPGRGPSRMTGVIWYAGSFSWGATTLGTLILARAAGLHAAATVTVIALELAGFCAVLAAALWARGRNTS